jgi:GMP synthase-like glutamine amidotransferase
MAKRLMVFQHMSWEKPGHHLVEAAQAQNVSLEVVEVWRQPIPDVTPYDGVIVLGGTPNVDQEKQYPFLKEEKKAISKILRSNKGYLGFCLGHQLLADALGAKVGSNFCRNVGFIEGHVTKEGRDHPLFSGMDNSFSLFKWHAQAVLPPLPKEIEVLVTSAYCQVEALSVKDRPFLVGFQFDNQSATVTDVRHWLEADEAWLSQPPGVNTTAILKDAEEKETLMGEQFKKMFANFIALVP